jgi:hypothetical protein
LKNVIVVIFSYNRFDLLNRLLTQLNSQENKHNLTIIVSDDKSPDNRYLSLNNLYEGLHIIRSETNNGKKGYWKTVNTVLEYIKNKDFDYLIQLDDDFEICDNFIDLVINFFDDIKNKTERLAAISLHLNSTIDGIGNRWGLGNSWVDGGAIYNLEAIKLLNYEIIEIKESRWKFNKTLSSGVWQQVSNRINRMGYIIAKPIYSFLNHNDLSLSEMNSNIRNTTPIHSYNFIDSKTPEDLSIYPINKILKPNNKKKDITPAVEPIKITPETPILNQSALTKPEPLYNPEQPKKPKEKKSGRITLGPKNPHITEPVINTQIAQPTTPKNTGQPTLPKNNVVVKPQPTPKQPKPQETSTPKQTISKIPNETLIAKLRKSKLRFNSR